MRSARAASTSLSSDQNSASATSTPITLARRRGSTRSACRETKRDTSRYRRASVSRMRKVASAVRMTSSRCALLTGGMPISARTAFCQPATWLRKYPASNRQPTAISRLTRSRCQPGRSGSSR